MHMADALLAPAVAATMYAATAVTVGASVKTLKKDEDSAKLPTMAVTSALVFAGQMINYTIPVPVPPDTSAAVCCCPHCWDHRPAFYPWW